MRQFNFEVGKVDMYYNIKLHYVESSRILGNLSHFWFIARKQ